MALFSRRKKSSDDAVASAQTPLTARRMPRRRRATPTHELPPSTAAELRPIGISVQAFRGVGARPAPRSQLARPPTRARQRRRAPAARRRPTRSRRCPAGLPQDRRLAARPRPCRRAQTETVAGHEDNVLLREALAEVEAGATNEQLLGVLRQALQGHLFLRVNGDARAQISEGKPLSVAVVARRRAAVHARVQLGAPRVRDSVQLEADPTATSAVGAAGHRGAAAGRLAATSRASSSTTPRPRTARCSRPSCCRRRSSRPTPT